jgi:hypothetical protein
MQLLIKTRHRQAQGLRDWVLVRAGFALRRLAWRVSHASVQMTDVDAPRRGVDKRCRVFLKATDGTPVVVTATARDWQSALNLALARAIEVFKQLFPARAPCPPSREAVHPGRAPLEFVPQPGPSRPRHWRNGGSAFHSPQSADR